MTLKTQAIQSLDRYLPSFALGLRARKELSQGEPELKLLQHLVSRDKVCIDIGANRGVYSYWFNKYGSKTIAIEPHPYCADYLRRAFGDKVDVMEGACSNVDGVATLAVPKMTGGINTYRSSISEGAVDSAVQFEKVQVPTFTLDAKAIDNVGLIKIDVEGHEEEVLSGAEETIAKNRPIVILEAEERHNKGVVSRVREWCSNRQYDARFLFKDRFVFIEEFMPSVHQVSDSALGPRTHSYANNFVLIPRECSGTWQVLEDSQR